MNVAHATLQNNWIYLIFFSVLSQIKVKADLVCYLLTFLSSKEAFLVKASQSLSDLQIQFKKKIARAFFFLFRKCIFNFGYFSTNNVLKNLRDVYTYKSQVKTALN